MGKLTRPSGIMISAISITTFRQIHYLLASLPGRTAKHCSRMEGERKTLNSALLPTEKKNKEKKLTLWVILFLSKSQAFISTAFTLYSGGRTWAAHNIEHSWSIPHQWVQEDFPARLPPLLPKHPHPLPSQTLQQNFFFSFFLPLPLTAFTPFFKILTSIAPLFKVFTSMLNLLMDFRPYFIGNLGCKTKGFFHINIFKQQGPLRSCILPSSFIQNKILYPVISAARLSFLPALQHLEAEAILAGRFQIKGACPNPWATVSRSLYVSLSKKLHLFSFVFVGFLGSFSPWTCLALFISVHLITQTLFLLNKHFDSFPKVEIRRLQSYE